MRLLIICVIRNVLMKGPDADWRTSFGPSPEYPNNERLGDSAGSLGGVVGPCSASRRGELIRLQNFL